MQVNKSVWEPSWSSRKRDAYPFPDSGKIHGMLCSYRGRKQICKAPPERTKGCMLLTPKDKRFINHTSGSVVLGRASECRLSEGTPNITAPLPRTRLIPPPPSAHMTCLPLADYRTIRLYAKLACVTHNETCHTNLKLLGRLAGPMG